MEFLEIKDEIVTTDEFKNNKEIKKILFVNAKRIAPQGKFSGCENLEEVGFEIPISKIGSRSFADCKLFDVSSYDALKMVFDMFEQMLF